MLRLPVPVAQTRVFPDEARDKLLWRILGHSCWAGWVLSLQHLGYYLFYENEEGDGRQTLFHWKKVFPPGWFCELRGLTLTAQRQPSAAGGEEQFMVGDRDREPKRARDPDTQPGTAGEGEGVPTCQQLEGL